MKSLAQLVHHLLQVDSLQQVPHLDHLPGKNSSWPRNLKMVLNSMLNGSADDHDGFQGHSDPSLSHRRGHVAIAATPLLPRTMHQSSWNVGLLPGLETSANHLLSH